MVSKTASGKGIVPLFPTIYVHFGLPLIWIFWMDYLHHANTYHREFNHNSHCYFNYSLEGILQKVVIQS